MKRKSGTHKVYWQGIAIHEIYKAEVLFHYLTSFAKFPAVNGAEYPSKTTWKEINYQLILIYHLPTVIIYPPLSQLQICRVLCSIKWTFLTVYGFLKRPSPSNQQPVANHKGKLMEWILPEWWQFFSLLHQLEKMLNHLLSQWRTQQFLYLKAYKKLGRFWFSTKFLLFTSPKELHYEWLTIQSIFMLADPLGGSIYYINVVTDITFYKSDWPWILHVLLRQQKG